MLPELNTYDWEEAFKYAGHPCGSPYSDPPKPPSRAIVGSAVSVAPFGREDVARIIAHQPGENDESAWTVVGELRDGRFFSLTAWCDYTGWG